MLIPIFVYLFAQRSGIRNFSGKESILIKPGVESSAVVVLVDRMRKKPRDERAVHL